MDKLEQLKNMLKFTCTECRFLSRDMSAEKDKPLQWRFSFSPTKDRGQSALFMDCSSVKDFEVGQEYAISFTPLDANIKLKGPKRSNTGEWFRETVLEPKE